MNEEQMLLMINDRIKEMVKNPEIQKIMLSFESDEEAKDWIIMAAIATLYGAVKK